MDPEMSAAVVGGIVGAVIGGVVAYVGGWLQSLRDRRRKRRALATVMLAELRIADASVRSFYDGSSGIVPDDAFQSFRLLDHAIESFSPKTVAAMLDFTSRLDGVRQLTNRFDSGATQKTPFTLALMRTLIVVVLDRLQPFAAALVDEGGIYSPFVPPRIPEGLQPESKSIPPLPQSVFPDLGSASESANPQADEPKDKK